MNLDDLQQRIRWGIVVVLVVVAVFLTILDSTNNTGNLFAFLQDPLTAVLAWTNSRSQDVNQLLEGPRNLEEARLEIDELQTRIDQLEHENEQLREVQGEYQVLLALFNHARQRPEIQRSTAKVIGRDTSPALQSLLIDQGRDNGVQIGMPVESARGLVGQIFRHTQNAAQVILITDNASSIPVRLGSSRATGLLRGNGLGGPLTIEWIDLRYQIEVGEVVLTSGLGGKFPEDLVIGRVIEVDRREADLFQRAIVQPAVDFSALETVFVITNFQPINTDIFGSPTQ